MYEAPAIRPKELRSYANLNAAWNALVRAATGLPEHAQAALVPGGCGVGVAASGA